MVSPLALSNSSRPKRKQSPEFLEWSDDAVESSGSATTPLLSRRDIVDSESRSRNIAADRTSSIASRGAFREQSGDWGASVFNSAVQQGAGENFGENSRNNGGADTPEDEEYDESSGSRPDVTPLDSEEQEGLLSPSATGPQYAYYWGAFDTALQRVFASLFCGLITANVAPIVAVPTGLYFLWAPVALAARRNAPLRRFAHAGIWHTRVLRIDTVVSGAPGGFVFDAMGDAFLPRKRAASVRCCPDT